MAWRRECVGVVGRGAGRSGATRQQRKLTRRHKHSHMFGPRRHRHRRRRQRLCRRLCLCLRLLVVVVFVVIVAEAEAPCRAECIAKMSICCWGCQACHVTLALGSGPPPFPSHSKRVLVSCMNVCGT